MNQIINQLYNELKHLNIQCQKDVSLKKYTTLHIGGLASLLVEPKTMHEIQECLKRIHQYHIPYTVLGNGSNVLALDEGYHGIIIVLSTYFQHVSMINDTTIKIQSGASLKDVCDYCLDKSLTGLEFACGIPGSIGGAVVMNAGAYGGQMQDVIKSVSYLNSNLEFKTIDHNQLDFDYRHSFFTDHQGIILEIEIELKNGQKNLIQEKMEDLMRKRYEKQPMEAYSAGSTFKRPVGYYASALIKESHLQGLKIGDASVSKKHAGFLINENNATSEDFLMLIKEVQRRVYRKSGYQLECEIKILDDKKV